MEHKKVLKQYLRSSNCLTTLVVKDVLFSYGCHLSWPFDVLWWKFMDSIHPETDPYWNSESSCKTTCEFFISLILCFFFSFFIGTFYSFLLLFAIILCIFSYTWMNMKCMFSYTWISHYRDCTPNRKWRYWQLMKDFKPWLFVTIIPFWRGHKNMLPLELLWRSLPFMQQFLTGTPWSDSTYLE